ncbi:MAG: hypothetical protein AAB482_04630 [Patescibacteria group bacterium]
MTAGLSLSSAIQGGLYALRCPEYDCIVFSDNREDAAHGLISSIIINARFDLSRPEKERKQPVLSKVVVDHVNNILEIYLALEEWLNDPDIPTS